MEEYSYARWAKGINRLVQVVLFITLVIAVNYIAATSFSRHDLTRTNQYSLSAETLAYLNQLEEPVRIIVSRPTDAASEVERMNFEHVSALLREYAYASRRGGEPMVQVETVNIYRQSDKAQELVDRFEIGAEQSNVIVVTQGDSYRQVLAPDLWKVEDETEQVFLGEQAFTSAILDVTNQNTETIYFLTGHGEMRPDDVDPLRGLSQISYYLRQRNFPQAPLDLSALAQVPEDAGLVVVAGPQTALLPEEQEKLRRYLTEENGRLLILLDPGREHGMDELFFDWGIFVHDMLVLEASNEFLASEGDSLVGGFEEHPITDLLRANQLKVLIGLSRPVIPDLGAPIDDSMTTTVLMQSSPQSWGERDYTQSPQRYSPETDLAG
ncbi:MAG: GldG family protein, partial [Verrucomicrobiota bacterium]